MIEFAVTFSPGADLDVNMGQVMEVLATEERTVELSMPSGNQVILPTSARGMRKVTVQKPDTMLPENIKKDVVIGGVTGALEAPPTGPYIEYTSLDSSGRVLTAKFRGTIVPEYAFAYLAELTSVDMPDNVIAIGDNGFYRCPKLQLTSLPPGITSLGDFAFSDCSKLALTSLPPGITSIGDQAFRDCFSLALTGLPSRITSIGDYTFRNCSKMALTSLPSGITSIGDFAFLNCYQRRPPRGGRGLKWCCPSQMACCSPFSFIVSFLFPLYISRSKNRPIIPLHSTQRARPPRRAPEASGTSPSLRFLQLAQDLLAHRLLWILRREILDLRCVIP